MAALKYFFQVLQGIWDVSITGDYDTNLNMQGVFCKFFNINFEYFEIY